MKDRVNNRESAKANGSLAKEERQGLKERRYRCQQQSATLEESSRDSRTRTRETMGDGLGECYGYMVPAAWEMRFRMETKKGGFGLSRTLGNPTHSSHSGLVRAGTNDFQVVEEREERSCL